ncbi:EF-P 5-aminopentanol modification-associated protein YfmF [Lentilactobacillus raoultii]|uniref:EF-P 5-aminopentanol modification-associated protein YfmF n=1 Tax=Lentilactobacillus raoultii TaxID=1987503 RepID=A0ABW3PIJ9_9LACO|nr:insulinase family protein [Lentilactobacillus raoultii]
MKHLTIEVARGIDLKIIQTDQFKNNMIVFNFTIPSNYQNFAKLALLAELLENASTVYPSEMLVSRKLSEMFGAGYGVTVLRYGNQHTLRIRLTFPQNQYLPNHTDLLAEAFSFLREMIEHPYANGNQFESSYFNVHQTNLVNYLQALPDNREFYSTLQLQKLYYASDLDQGHYLLGTANEVRNQDADHLYTFYKEFLKKAQISVIVAGQIDSEVVRNQLTYFATFSERNADDLSLYIRPQLPMKTREKTEVVPGSQSILNLGYRLPVYFNDRLYLAATIFNQIFGASTRSLLFTNVREKASLAYDIHSSYNSFAGMLSVQAGIDFEKMPQVIQTINLQLTAVVNGDYPDDLLIGVKNSMINQHRSQSDYLTTLVERQYLRQISGISYEDKQWESAVMAVTKRDIAEVAKQVHYEARYVLQSQGGQNETN